MNKLVSKVGYDDDDDEDGDRMMCRKIYWLHGTVENV